MTVSTSPAPEPVELFERNRFLVSGQPSKADLAAIAGRGVTTVVCTRSDEEMAELIAEDGFDERAAVEALGMTYVHIPMGTDHGYEPHQVARLNAVLDSADGPVYLHCGSGYRARQLWMASMVSRGTMTVDEAKLAARDLGEREPALDQLLGRRVTYKIAPAEPSTAAEPADSD
ncbi:MAG: protein tyrosine phosphatase family protein [Planctomycetota bacterium]